MSRAPITTHNLGFPRIGADRELKKAVEAYWAGRIDRPQLEDEGRQLRRRHWQWQAEAGLDLVPTGDFAWYDQVLTMSATVGNIPRRHHAEGEEFDLDTLFRAARGKAPTGHTAQASEMTKWFDTNYHYLVPEFHAGQQFSLAWRQIIEETAEAVERGYKAKPVILGPISYLWLGKEKDSGFDRLDLLEQLLPVYHQLLQALSEAGAEWVQIDEPILVHDLPAHWRRQLEPTYQQLQTGPVKLLLATYFGGLEDNLHTALHLPVDGLHIDAARAPGQIKSALDWLPINRILSIGFVDGRNIWRNDLARWKELLDEAHERIGDRLWLAPSCSLLHVPVDLQSETALDPQIRQWLAFARQKLSEVVTVGRILSDTAGEAEKQALADSRAAVDSRRHSTHIHDAKVQERSQAVTERDCLRDSPFAERSAKQQARLKLPLFPTTTIGSFPQTEEIRKTRRDHRQGRLSEDVYRQRMRQAIADTVRRQEALDIDVLVHGEAERNDMVEYFGEQLRGFAFTQYGWVQSYGSRCVKPPVIYGDVSRPEPITVDWIRYAQSLTDHPLKGMLTGPTTMLQWSFVRDDQSRAATAQQIALALRDEATDLEAAGIGIIQIDEPALREGLPLRRNAHKAYLDQAVKAFRLASCGVGDETQIHTHMCYAEFNDIIEAIAALDADVITIETSRSDGELLQAFEDFEYPNQIGPGVYDIHSPNVPETGDMVRIMERCARHIPVERLWVNPDCGLKTRDWPETEAALARMVEAARTLRAPYGQAQTP